MHPPRCSDDDTVCEVTLMHCDILSRGHSARSRRASRSGDRRHIRRMLARGELHRESSYCMTVGVRQTQVNGFRRLSGIGLLRGIQHPTIARLYMHKRGSAPTRGASSLHHAALAVPWTHIISLLSVSEAGMRDGCVGAGRM